jgi:hypothetical protein
MQFNLNLSYTPVAGVYKRWLEKFVFKKQMCGNVEAERRFEGIFLKKGDLEPT